MSKIGVVTRTIRNIIGLPAAEPEVNSLSRAVAAITEQMEIIVGNKGDVLDRAVTLQDMVDLEVLEANQSSSWDITSLAVGPALGGGVVGYADKSVLYIQESGGSTWNPSTPQDVLVTFKQGAETLATATIRASLNTSTGDVTVTLQANTGESTTLSVTNNTTPAPTVSVTHDESEVVVPLSIGAVEGGLQGPAGSDGAAGADGADGADGLDGVVPAGIIWGGGLTNIQLFANRDSTGLPDDGEIRLTPGSLRMPDGTTRTLSADGQVNTPFEGATVPPVTAGIFYLIWGASAPSARFGSAASTWGNTAAEAAGFFAAYYDRPQWTAINNDGTTYNFTPATTDLIFAAGFKTSVTGGIDSMTPVAPFTGDLGIFDTVPVGYIDPDTITTLELAANAVEAANIAVNAVQEVHIDTNAVGTDQIQAGSVTANEIAAASITGDRIAANTIESGNIVARTIQAGDIATNAITANEIAAATITGGEIAANAIVTSNIAAGAIQSNNIAADAVTADKINVTTLAAISANMGTITAGSMDAARITSGVLAAGRVSADNITTGTLNADRIRVDGATIDTDGTGRLIVRDSGVGTSQIAQSAVSVPSQSALSSATISSTNWVTIVTSTSINVAGGSALCIVSGDCGTFGAPGNSSHDDGGVQFALQVSTGSGYVDRVLFRAGARNDGSSDVNWYIPISALWVEEAVPNNVQVRLRARAIDIGNGIKSTAVTNAAVTVIAFRR